MATHSSILAWGVPWTEEPGRLRFIGLQSWTRLKWLSTAQHRNLVLDWLAGLLSLSLLCSKNLKQIPVSEKNQPIKEHRRLQSREWSDGGDTDFPTEDPLSSGWWECHPHGKLEERGHGEISVERTMEFSVPQWSQLKVQREGGELLVTAVKFGAEKKGWCVKQHYVWMDFSSVSLKICQNG